MKEAYKGKCFSESAIFRSHADFKRLSHWSAEQALKHDQSESIVNDQMLRL